MNNKIVVVGSGIIGLAVSFELSMSGSAQVVCVSPEYFAHSATMASGAMLGVHAENTFDKVSTFDEAEFRLRYASNRLYPEWLNKIEEFSSIKVSLGLGTFIVANSAGREDVVNIKHMQRLCGEVNDRWEWVEPDEVPGLKPHRSLRPFKVLYLPDEGYVNSATLHRALLEACRNRGVQFVHEAVERLIVKKDRAEAVQTTMGNQYYGDHIIVCAGVNTGRIIDTYNARDNKLIPKLFGAKGSSMLIETQLNLPHVIRTPNRAFACGMHVVPRDRNLIYVGATNRVSDTPSAYKSPAPGEIHTQLHSLLHEINTSLYTCGGILEMKSGLRPVTVDGYPLFGHTGLHGLSVATGTYRNGILLAPVIAYQVAREIVSSADMQIHWKDNEFSPLNRDKILAEAKDYRRILKLGVRDLVSSIQEPHGSLPYQKSKELAKLIEWLLVRALEPNADPDLTGLLEELSTFGQRESFAKLFRSVQDKVED